MSKFSAESQSRREMKAANLAYASGFAVVALLCGFGAALVGFQRPTLAIVAFLAAVVAVAALPLARGHPVWLYALIATLGFSSVLPLSIGIPLQVVALAAPYIYWLRTSPSAGRGLPLVVLCAITSAYWAALMFHPNIPDLSIGFSGYRKTVLALSGLVLGCAIPVLLRRRVEILVVAVLTTALGLSIVSFYLFPEISDLVVRSADRYTSLIGGVARLQGVFAGPFHAGLAGAFVCVWAIFRFRDYPVASGLVAAVGFTALTLTMVRTAFIALAAGVFAIILISGSLRSLVRRAALACLALLSMLMVVGIVGDAALSATLSSIGNVSADSRFLNRLPTYQIGLNLLSQSPVFGWGAGSAGDTLGAEFGFGYAHVTPHNIFLKYAVEGGLIGLTLFVAIVILIFRRIKSSSSGQVALIAVVMYLVMGLTISVSETLPVSYFLMVLVGIGCGSPRQVLPRTLSVHSSLISD
jgi:O-antigen ligase